MTAPVTDSGIFRTLVHTTPAPACVTSARDQRFLDANDEMLRMLGYERDELVGHTAAELKIWRSAPLGETQQQLAREGHARGVQLTFFTKRGEERQCLASLDTMLVDGEPAILSTCVDVTERAREAERIRESEERFRRAFDDAAIGMALFDATGHYQRVNRALCEMLGREESEIVGKDWKDFTHPDDVQPVTDRGAKTIERQPASSIRLEKRYLRKDGSIVWASLTSSAVRDAEGRTVQYVTQIQDVTEQKRAEEELRGQTMARSIVRRLLVSIIHRGHVSEAVVREVGRDLAREAEPKSVADAMRAFQQLGFGTLTLEKSDGNMFTFSGNDLLERRRASPYPTCYLTLSFLEGSLASVAGGTTLGTETRCQSKGHEKCVFVLVRREAKT